MTSRLSERKKKDKTFTNDQTELAPFKLPDSLHCSEVEFPILIKKRPKVKWSEILEENEKHKKEIEEYVAKKNETELKSPFLKTETEYIQKRVFNQLLPALEETLVKAKIWEALQIQKCFFNGIDHIVQIPETIELLDSLTLRQVACSSPVPIIHKEKLAWDDYINSPRPYYPKSWLWPEEYAATMIQKTVRQYFVQREEEVQEMREFWKKLEYEKDNPDIVTNPLLARRLASLRDINKNKKFNY